MKRTLLYFGSFNPIHVGHMVIANYAMANDLADELWFIVSPQNPFKTEEVLAPEQDRMEMAKIAIRETEMQEMAYACDIEFYLPTPSYTIHTLRKLWEQHPDREFSILMGSDNMADLAKWKDYQQITQKCRIFVYPRSGTSSPDKGYDAANITLLTDAPVLEMSSTQIRGMLAEGKKIPALVPHGVYEYIVRKRLYGKD